MGARWRWVAMALLLSVATRAGAQHMFEGRYADTRYRYLDWNYTFPSGAVADLFYVGVPGGNEFNAGGGYTAHLGPSLLLTPLVYAVVGQEADQRGVKLALLVGWEHRGWKLGAFLGHFARFEGDVSNYQVLDTADFSRTITRQVDLGVSAGFFRQSGSWNEQYGPLVRWNDRLGSWALSWRFGEQNELRFARVLLLKR